MYYTHFAVQFPHLPWGNWVGTTHGIEMEPSARLPLPKPTGPTHASPHITTSLCPYLAHMRTLLTPGSWHGWPQSSRIGIPDSTVGNSEFKPTPETSAQGLPEMTRPRGTCQIFYSLSWIKPTIGIRATAVGLVLQREICTGNCGSARWPGTGNIACSSGIKVGHVWICVA